LIELIFDEMGANKSMIFRIQLNRTFMLNNELKYRNIAKKIENYTGSLEQDIQRIVVNLSQKLENLKAPERQALSKNIINLLKIYNKEIEDLLKENGLTDWKIFQQSLQQLKH